MNEKLLIFKLKSKDAEAFREFINSYQKIVLNTCFKFVHDRKDAEDLAQDVFVEVYLSVNKFKGDSSLSTWLYRIAVNKSLDFIRRKKRKKRLASLTSLFGLNLDKEPSIRSTSTPLSILEQDDKIGLLLKALARLPENQKTAIILAKHEGLSYLEISEILKTSPSAVDSLIQRAKQNLKKILLSEDF